MWSNLVLLALLLGSSAAAGKMDSLHRHWSGTAAKADSGVRPAVQEEMSAMGAAARRARYTREVMEEAHNLDKQVSPRYIGHCNDNKMINMYPGNARWVWSYGYKYLGIPYEANCTMKHIYNTRASSDPFCSYGFMVTGTFESYDATRPCEESDHLKIYDDTGLNSAIYCGSYSEISWTTAQSDFTLEFNTLEDSLRGKGWIIKIQSFKLCGGLISLAEDGPSGTLQTPFYPLNYPNDVACTWVFLSETLTTVRIGCSAFKLQDPVTLPNGTTYCLDLTSFTSEVPQDPSTTRYCSDALDQKSREVYSVGSYFLMQFRTDSSVVDTGFSCDYEFIKYAM